MNSPWTSKHLVLLLALAAGGTDSVASADQLEVTAATPEVTISTRPAGRNFLQLPVLTYEFVVDLSCSDDRQAASLSLSIADTRIRLSADRLAGREPITVGMRVPADQIAPVAVAGFCVDETAEGTAEQSLIVPAVLSAQLSLLCASEDASHMTYASRALDVVIHCDPRPDAAATPVD